MLGNSTAIADVFKRIGRNWDILNAKRAFGYTRKYDEDTYQTVFEQDLDV